MRAQTADAARVRAAIAHRWPDLDLSSLDATPVPTSVEGTIDPSVVSAAVPGSALAACIPPSPSVSQVHLVASETGAITADVTPSGATADCIRRVIEAAHVPPPEGGSATLDGIVFFP
jgi:hypothetical protein